MKFQFLVTSRWSVVEKKIFENQKIKSFFLGAGFLIYSLRYTFCKKKFFVWCRPIFFQISSWKSTKPQRVFPWDFSKNSTASHARIRAHAWAWWSIEAFPCISTRVCALCARYACIDGTRGGQKKFCQSSGDFFMH